MKLFARIQNHTSRHKIRETKVEKLKEQDLPDAFLMAVKDCNLERLQKIVIKSPAPIDASQIKDENGNTALHFVVGEFCKFCTQLDENDKPLMDYYRGITEIIKYLSSTFPNLTSITNNNGLAPAHLLRNLPFPAFLLGIQLICQDPKLVIQAIAEHVGEDQIRDDFLTGLKVTGEINSRFLGTNPRFVNAINEWLFDTAKTNLKAGKQLSDQEAEYFSRIAFAGDNAKDAAKMLIYNDVLREGFLKEPLPFGHQGARYQVAVDDAFDNNENEIDALRKEFIEVRAANEQNIISKPTATQVLTQAENLIEL